MDKRIEAEADMTNLLVDTAMMAAVIILENGGETFRARGNGSQNLPCRRKK